MSKPVKKKTSTENRAFLKINTRPWTNVYIDGKLIKATPIYKYPISPGSHKIRFSNKKLGINKTIPVDLKPGEVKKIIKKF